MSLSAESSTLFPTPLARGTVSGGDPVTVSLVPWPPPLDDGGSGQMKGINALIAAIKFQINGSLFFPGTPIQRPIGELWVVPSPVPPTPTASSVPRYPEGEEDPFPSLSLSL